MPYDYICSECGHEFDYDEAIQSFSSDEWFECPFCKNEIDEHEEAYNNS